MAQIARPNTAFSLDKRSRQRKPRQHAKNHLHWITTLPSLVAGSGRVDPAHIRYAEPRYAKTSTGKAEKPSDCWVVPLARSQHDAQHDANERQWWVDRGIDPLLVAALLWAHTGNDHAAEQVIRFARQIGKSS